MQWTLGIIIPFFFLESQEINGLQEEDEDEAEEVVYEEEKLETEPHIDLKEAEGGMGIENMADPICHAGTSRPSDEEQAGPSGLNQQCRAAHAVTSKLPLVVSDSDSEEEEGLSRLIPPTCLQEPAACPKGVSTTQATHSQVLKQSTTRLLLLYHEDIKHGWK
ncbi:hypothetical protein AMECASPLE_034121 [Ameca splendens]|uniref:Uncharacterized protein n=1 Tax=Ameca splendens TaxID=208324 RepID=A0ABV0YIR6_9TELE